MQNFKSTLPRIRTIKYNSWVIKKFFPLPPHHQTSLVCRVIESCFDTFNRYWAGGGGEGGWTNGYRLVGGGGIVMINKRWFSNSIILVNWLGAGKYPLVITINSQIYNYLTACYSAPGPTTGKLNFSMGVIICDCVELKGLFINNRRGNLKHFLQPKGLYFSQ